MNEDILYSTCPDNWYTRVIDENYLYCVGNTFVDIEYIILKSFVGFDVYEYKNGKLSRCHYLDNENELLAFIKGIN